MPLPIVKKKPVIFGVILLIIVVIAIQVMTLELENITQNPDESEILEEGDNIPQEDLPENERIAAFNKEGFRGPKIIKEKPENTYRIFAVGGSTTFGSALLDHQTWPYYLQKKFDVSGLSTTIEVINAGISGASSKDETLLIKERLLDYDPDLYIVYDGWNDFIHYTKGNDELIWKNRWIDTCEFNNQQGIDTIVTLQPFMGSGKKSLTESELDILQNYHDDAIPFVEFAELYALQIEELNAHCTKATDLRSIFDSTTKTVYDDEAHPVPLGNQIVAENMYKLALPIVLSNLGESYANVITEVLDGTVLVGADLTNANLDGVDLSGQDLSGTVLKGVDLSGRSFSNTIFEGVDLSGRNLINSIFHYTNFDNADLTDTNLTNSSFIQVDFTKIKNKKLTNTDLRGASFAHSNLEGVDLSGSNFKYINFQHANLVGQDFTGVTFFGTIFNWAKLANSNFEGVDLSPKGFVAEETFLNKANLANLDRLSLAKELYVFPNRFPISVQVSGNNLIVEFFFYNNFEFAELQNANFANANLQGTSFENAILTNANFQNAIIIYSDLRNADLRGANLSNADLTDSFLTNANLAKANVSSVIINGAVLDCINHEICN